MLAAEAARRRPELLTREIRLPSFERAILICMRATVYALVVLVAAILFQMIWKGWDALSWEFLSQAPRRGGMKGGIFPAIVGTFLLIAGTIMVSLPLGMASAIYLSEYAKQGRLNVVIRLAISTLAGVPSIVFGLFGLGLFVIFMGFGASLAAGCLTLACMILPTIIVTSEEALRSVPAGLREASLALGASKWQAIRTNVLPYALPGMLTGSVLGIGRAAGETAPIMFTAAAFYLSKLPKSIFDQVMALPYHLFILSTQQPDTTAALPRSYATALVLLTLVLSFNLIAIIARIRLRKKYRW